ncbi:MAG TPA: alpha/beta fold hydrolase [Pseudomonadota bacterium]|nr:alpha/beta fold hydrolase [Pseudomonadota bacterium]HNK44340.1 alpha/beta fold hydrolase [Pseudomonadota bacterium]HNN53671.1 alpha/beta fold hydrolase [Pseudomonadota bacterium]HNO68858.1 alpha/beta fold hydrolase [Pseudomonadota bacterium]
MQKQSSTETKQHEPTFRQRGRAFALLVGVSLAALGCGDGTALPDSEQPAQLAQPLSCKGAPYPIVLAHGFAGFERIGPLNYFFQVGADLRSRGETVVEAKVPPYESSDVRAAALAAVVDDTLKTYNACKVNVIGHSQGGIDGRALISGKKYGNKVASLVTVSTPHRGTEIADVVSGLVPGFSYDVINAILKAVSGLTDAPGSPNLKNALAQLTTPGMQRWNAANPDDPAVRYYSVAGRSAGRIANSECAGGAWGNSSRIDLLDPLLALPEGVFAIYSDNPLVPRVNDGLVTVQSAKWGKFLGCVPADHLDEVGQIGHLFPDVVSGFSHKELYRKIVAELRKDGL